MKKINKRKMLGIEKTKELKKDMSFLERLSSNKIIQSNAFFSLILRNKLPYNLPQFLLASIAFGALWAFIFALLFKNVILTVGFGVLGALIPYSFVNSNALLDAKVREKMEYQTFIETLQTELQISSSISGIFEGILQRGTNDSVKEILEHAVKNLQLGESIPSVLKDCEDRCREKYLKIVFVILKINYDLGSAETIRALDAVKEDFNHSINNLVELKDKISGNIADKNIFVGLSAALPIIVCMYKPDYFNSLLNIPWAEFIIIGVVTMTMVGGFLIDKKVRSMLGVV